MLKPFTGEGRFECGLDLLVHGKTWAFVAVLGDERPAQLSVAVQGERGYHPIPAFWCEGDEFAAMQVHAEALNAAEGLDPRAAASIVASSMRRDVP